MAIAATEPLRRMGAKLLAKAQQSADVLKQEGAFRFLELSALSLSEPVRSFRLRAAVAADAKRTLVKINSGTRRRGLFIDCGSNIGQGYRFFSKYYTPPFFDFILVEPNRNCIPYLEELRECEDANIEIIGKAASVKNGFAELFGPSARRQELTYEGRSIVPEHNSGLYESESAAADLVETFSLSQMIMAKREAYDVVVMKMDIEGAEYEVLDDIIDNCVHRYIYAAYVEFHSLYMKRDERAAKRTAEARIKTSLTRENVLFREWI